MGGAAGGGSTTTSGRRSRGSSNGGRPNLALRFGGALWRFWYTRGYLSEGQVDGGSTRGGEPAASPVRVKALEGMGWLTQAQGDTERAEATYEEMLELSRELDDKGNARDRPEQPGDHGPTQGDNERARALLEENLSVLRELEDEENAATTLKRFHALNLLAILASTRKATTHERRHCWRKAWRWPGRPGTPSAIGQPSSTWGTWHCCRETTSERRRSAKRP